jgi:hypothetical protein
MSTYVVMDGGIVPSIYLPPVTSDDVDYRLMLLEKMAEEDTIPYTEEQERVFLVARTALSRANLGLSPIGYAVILAVPTILTLIAAGTIEADPKVALAMGVLAVVISNVVSMYFTGTLPNNSSNAQNRDQDEMAKLKDRFDDFADYLLQRHLEEPSSITQRARVILQLLREKEGILERSTTQKASVEPTMKYLRDVLNYIVTGNTNHNSRLELALLRRNHHAPI